MDGDDVFLALLRPEEEREKSLAAAKAALTAEKWSAMEGESLSVRVQLAGSFHTTPCFAPLSPCGRGAGGEGWLPFPLSRPFGAPSPTRGEGGAVKHQKIRKKGTGHE